MKKSSKSSCKTRPPAESRQDEKEDATQSSAEDESIGIVRRFGAFNSEISVIFIKNFSDKKFTKSKL